MARGCLRNAGSPERDRPRITIGGLMSLVLLCGLLMALRMVQEPHVQAPDRRRVLVLQPGLPSRERPLTIKMLRVIMIRRRGLRIGRGTKTSSAKPPRVES